MSTLTDAERLAIARDLARRANLLITEQRDRKPDGRVVPTWVIYRHQGNRNIRVCKRSSPADLLRLVRNMAGTAALVHS